VRALKTKRKVDPFTVEIIRNGLIAAAEEMFYSLARTSHSPVIYEVLDYACGLTDSKARLIAQANGLPGFLGTLTFGVKDVLVKFGEKSLFEGDVIVTNTPYGGGGSHLSDVVLVAPVFYKNLLVGFSVNKAHWTEIGGKDPGSWTTNSTEIFQEGLHFPCVKLFERGKEIASVVDIIRANSRLPDQTIGDMRAQAASLKVASKRVRSLCDKYGANNVLDAMQRIIAWGLSMTKHHLQKLPHGTFEAQQFMDNYGFSDESPRVKARVTITDDEFIVDFTGSDKALNGPVNTTYPMLNSACRTMIKTITDPHLEANEGCFLPLKVIVPRGTVFSAEHPSPTATYWEAAGYAEDVVWKALAPIIRDKLTAGHFLSVCATIVGGIRDEDGQTWLLVEPQAGGWGAGSNKDGENGLVCSVDGETYIMPVEIQETRYPILVDQFSLNTASAGAGKRRGGFGLVRDYRIMSSNGFVTIIFGRNQYPPWGVDGGHDGSTNFVEIISNKGASLKTARLTVHRLEGGDVVRLVTGVGGGYGDPFKREPALVRDDVVDGYISCEEARKIYGVSLNTDAFEIDYPETQQVRRST
jgi:N-methylhydantoinase B